MNLITSSLVKHNKNYVRTIDFNKACKYFEGVRTRKYSKNKKLPEKTLSVVSVSLVSLVLCIFLTISADKRFLNENE